MPLYEFRNKTGDIVTKRAPFATAHLLFRRMERRGYQQVYSPRKAVIHLSYQEALEETDVLLAQADRGEGDLVRDASKEAKRKASKFFRRKS